MYTEVDKDLASLPKTASSISKNHPTKLCNFVFELDNLDLIKSQKMYIYRIVYDGNRSYNIWVRVKNAPQSLDEYEKLARSLNSVLFLGLAKPSSMDPYKLVAAPDEINSNTGWIQKVICRPGYVITVCQ
jgi:hypothetical protein